MSFFVNRYSLAFLILLLFLCPSFAKDKGPRVSSYILSCSNQGNVSFLLNLNLNGYAYLQTNNQSYTVYGKGQNQFIVSGVCIDTQVPLTVYNGSLLDYTELQVTNSSFSWGAIAGIVAGYLLWMPILRMVS